MRSICGALVLILGASVPLGQTAHPRSPREVVEQFWAFETAGGRLTDDGWRQASEYFTRLGQLPSRKQISVVYKDYSVGEPVMKGNTAEVIVEVLPQGQIDGELRFTPSESYKEGLSYHLVLTDKHTDPGSNGQETKVVTGPGEWRIDGTGATLWLNVAAAIHYVSTMRQKTTDPAVTKNADEALTKLRKLR